MRGLGVGAAGAAQPGTARRRAAIATATAAASLLMINELDTRCAPPVLDVDVAPGGHHLRRSIPFRCVERAPGTGWNAPESEDRPARSARRRLAVVHVQEGIARCSEPLATPRRCPP